MSAGSIVVVSPVADYRDIDREAARHAVRAGLTNKRALLLPAEKSSSPPFIEVLMKRMAAETQAKHVFTENPEWPFFHSARASSIGTEIDAVARQCDLVISAVAY